MVRERAGEGRVDGPLLTLVWLLRKCLGWTRGRAWTGGSAPRYKGLHNLMRPSGIVQVCATRIWPNLNPIEDSHHSSG